MNLEKLKGLLNANIKRINEHVSQDEYRLGMAGAYDEVLSWLDEPWEPDVALLEKTLHASIADYNSRNQVKHLKTWDRGVWKGLATAWTMLTDSTALLAEAKRLGLEE